MKYLQKNRKRVFLLAESEEKLNTVENAMKYYDKGIFLTGHALIKEGENREEDVVNERNRDGLYLVRTDFSLSRKVYRGKSSSFKCKTVVRMWNSA